MLHVHAVIYHQMWNVTVVWPMAMMPRWSRFGYFPVIPIAFFRAYSNPTEIRIELAMRDIKRRLLRIFKQLLHKKESIFFNCLDWIGFAICTWCSGPESEPESQVRCVMIRVRSAIERRREGTWKLRSSGIFFFASRLWDTWNISNGLFEVKWNM